MATLMLLVVSLACTFTLSVDTSTAAQPTIAVNIDTLSASFRGQDGGDNAGRLCTAGTTNDNVHIHLTGLRAAVEPISYRVDDYAQGGVWANPCDPVSNWMLHIKNVAGGEADLYFKPFRDAPAGTDYMI
ncbi:MAG TPA: hypothetical protein VFK30_11375, partial [Anaerolineae bacterium]|nr:hypothetical protein [Anaerolineae bacterium]